MPKYNFYTVVQSYGIYVHHTLVLCQNKGMQRDEVFTIG